MLPFKPSFFDKALEGILRVDGKPFYRCVNPQTEKEFRAGKIRLKHIDFENFCKPKNCWVIEYYQSPSEINEHAWEQIRYRFLEVRGQGQVRTDMLGEYPRNGRYVFFQDVVDELGNPISPNQKLIDSIQAKVNKFMAKQTEWEHETPEQGEKRILDYTEEVEKERLEKHTSEFFQFHGIAAQKAYDTVISKPMIITPPKPSGIIIKP
jgi:hypothetical protein